MFKIGDHFYFEAERCVDKIIGVETRPFKGKFILKQITGGGAGFVYNESEANLDRRYIRLSLKKYIDLCSK